MADCPICFQSISTSETCVYAPCKHVFCRRCVQRALEYDVRCPLCRMVAQNIDPPPNLAHHNKTLTIQLDGTGRLGVSLYVSPTSKSSVKIKSFSKKSQGFHQGLRVNDIIVGINSIPCHNISTTQRLLAHGFNTSVQIQIFRPQISRTYFCRWRWFRAASLPAFSL